MEGYKKIEDGVVDSYKKIEETVVDNYKTVEESFVEKFLTKEGETVEEAKERIAKEQEEREVQTKARTQVNVTIPNSNEIVKKNLEAAKNAGKKKSQLPD